MTTVDLPWATCPIVPKRKGIRDRWTKGKKKGESSNNYIPILIVAWFSMTSSERGVKVEKSIFTGSVILLGDK